METVFTFVKYGLFGFFGLIAVLFVFALIFGKRKVTKWEFEAEFRDASGREFGEFDIELSHISKEETEDTFKAKFRLKHESLREGQQVQVFLDDILVLQGAAEAAGRAYLAHDEIVTPLANASAGQLCRVVYGGQEHFSEQIVLD